MELLRVFNNNVVLAAADDGREVILTGRGLGFQARPGQPIDEAKVARVFVPTDGRDPDHLAELLAGIPAEAISLVSNSLAGLGQDQLARNPALVAALADHVDFAIRRTADDLVLEYPLVAEVVHLYPDEYAQAKALLARLNEQLAKPLPQAEAVALALHLVNAGFSGGDLAFTYKLTGVIQQLLVVVEQSFGISLDGSSVNVGRFVTHLRYLFVRIEQHRQLAESHAAINAAIRDASPDGFACARRVASLLELRLGSALTEDEVAYLALHIARLTAEA